VGQPVGPIFKGQAVEYEAGTDVIPKRTNLRQVTSRKSEDFDVNCFYCTNEVFLSNKFPKLFSMLLA
jgi:hypothetical protein